MLSTPPALISVIGPVEPPLLAAWVRHYRKLGIERFLIAFHFPEHIPGTRRHELHAVAREVGIIPARTSTGPWHEHTNGELRDELRHRAGQGWHLLADADEFHQYPGALPQVIAHAEKAGHRVLGGLMLDRVTESGRLTGWRSEGGLDRAYPLGGHLTHRLLRADPRKVVLARHDVTVASGNHRSPGHRPDPDRLCKGAGERTLVQDDRDPRHYAAARGPCAALPSRSSSARAFASASGLGAQPRTEASSARANSAPSAYSACVGSAGSVTTGTGRRCLQA
ncbi:glycosyltransferase family 2 protein [Streptomyces durhamensis]|uniref:glycosyltransferase family 2 protein n=1 Tax=Streptomyces durhamensis TaxID=68194 RepID=UPI00099D7D58|nr:glycosyltransferase family 2 protein [Streptomyces durhamensis]